VKLNPYLTFSGQCETAFKFYEKALGGKIEVPTIDGKMTEVPVDAGTQPGHRTRIKQKGMSILHSASRGDLYVELAVETPVHMSKRQRELLDEFAVESQKHRTSPESENFLSKVKEMLKG